MGVSERTFRRCLNRYETEGEEGLPDRRLGRSNRRAPVDEVLALQEQYRTQHPGWNARHFHSWLRWHPSRLYYTWVKSHLQAAGLLGELRKIRRKKMGLLPKMFLWARMCHE